VGWLHGKHGDGDLGAVGPLEADALVRGGAVLLDVREPAEWQTGHAAGAFHVPLGELEGRLAALPGDRRVVVICRSGNRSATATSLLVRSGFDAVNLRGGMQAWSSAGLPVETGDAQPGTVV
jgi:rhodanese-related sulfurtransferase